MTLYSFTRSYELLEEAKQYVPNGIYGPRSPTFLTYGSYPAFLARGEGCRIWDVDGNEYVDYMCSFGTNLLGLRHPKIDGAARRQQEKGDCFTLPSDLWVPLARKLVETIHGMGWCVFGKNGSDVTSYAITVARAFTGRKEILVARGAYHGAHFWCQGHGEGVPEEWKTHIHDFEYNDPADFRRAVEAERGKIAAVILTPHRHDVFRDQELPGRAFVEAVNEVSRQEGFLVVIDDIRCGFRLKLEGSASHYGYRADLNCFGKAMANGYPIAVAMGRQDLKPAAEKVYFTGTHFFSGVPFAAALATMEEIRASGAIEKIRALGTRLMTGLEEAAAAKGVRVTLSGPPAMPYMTFAGDPGLEKSRFFCGEAARRGIFFHPHHNWFVCAALTDADLAKTVEVSQECFRLTREKFGG
jgi:glutamate-1-semialdehyde 2,1-aminomutase